MNYLAFAQFPWLTLLILTPLLGALLAALAGVLRMPETTIRTGAVAWALLPLGIAVWVWSGFAGTVADGQGVIQFVEKVAWVQAIRVDYFLGVDGLSLPLVLLTALMTPVAMLASVGVRERVGTHYAMLFLLEAMMLGFFTSLNFFFFFIFWEFSLVPAFFLIYRWGRDPQRRGPAAIKFFVYTLAGSMGLLLVFAFLYLATAASGVPTFDLITLARLGMGLGAEGVTQNLQTIVFTYVEQIGLSNVLGRFPLLYSSILFWAIYIAFAIKLGVWPFHTWLPDAYAEAPTAGSVLLSAVMSKMGAYGMLRILLPLAPEAAQYFGPALAGLALISILTGAFAALGSANADLKRMIGFTSINHMGYVALAVAAVATLGVGGDAAGRATALNGAVMQMVAHGLSTGALFCFAAMLAERTGSYNIRAASGLRAHAPILAGAMGVALFANLGLPGLAGFVGEFLIFRGAWASLGTFALLATVGLVVTALALLRVYGALFNGPASPTPIRDLSPGGVEFLSVAPLLLLLIFLGVYPTPVLDVANQAATALAQLFTRALT